MWKIDHLVVYVCVVGAVWLVLLDAGYFRRGRHRGDWGRCRGAYLVEREKKREELRGWDPAAAGFTVQEDGSLLWKTTVYLPETYNSKFGTITLIPQDGGVADVTALIPYLPAPSRLPDWPPLLGEDHGSFGAFGDVHIDRADNTPVCGSVPVRYGRGEVTGGG